MVEEEPAEVEVGLNGRGDGNLDGKGPKFGLGFVGKVHKSRRCGAGLGRGKGVEVVAVRAGGESRTGGAGVAMRAKPYQQDAAGMESEI